MHKVSSLLWTTIVRGDMIVDIRILGWETCAVHECAKF